MEQQIDLQNSDIKENVPDTLEKAISNILKKYKSKAHLIYHIDEHLSEYSEKNYIAPITNFTGSNAVILIIQNDEIELLLYTDGRYFTQAEQELKEFKLMKIDEDDPPSVLLKERLTKTNEKISITIDMKKLGNNTYDLLKKSLPDVEFKQLSNEEFLSQIPENLLYQTRNDNDTKEGNGNKEDNDDQNYKLIDLESFKMKDIFKLDKNLKVKNYFEKMMKNLIPVHSVFEKMTAYKKNQKFLNILKESENIVSNNLPVTKLTFEQKRRIILSFIESDDKKSVFLVTDLTDIAWLLNLRSNKFYNGNFPAWMVISHDVSILFTDYEVKNRDVVLRPYDEFWPYFDSHIVTSGDISDEQSVKDINSRDLNSRDRNSGDLKSG
ncbi:Xaa-Pro aminopeptidase, partial [Pseudoloma neurophilia]